MSSGQRISVILEPLRLAVIKAAFLCVRARVSSSFPARGDGVGSSPGAQMAFKLER